MSPEALIIEDQRQLAEAVAKLLARYGIRSDLSGDGVDALHKIAGRPYDLLIVDLHLPRLSGVEVIRKVRATSSGRSLPVIIVSGVYKGEVYLKRARDTLGVRHYLEKPFTQEEFLAAVKDALPGSLEPVKKERPASAGTADLPEPKAAQPARTAATVRAPAQPAAAREAPSVLVSPARPVVGPQQVAGIQPTPALQGDLSTRPLDILLVELEKRRATGVLFVKKGEDECSVLFVNGLPLGIRTSNIDSSFGNHLFCQGRISLMEYQVYQGMAGNDGPPDELFIKMGALLPDEFYAEHRRFLEESLIRMMSQQDAEFTFRIWPDFPAETPAPPVNLSHVVHQGYKKHVPAQRVQAAMKRARDRYPVLLPGYYDRQMHLDIGPEEALLLDTIDGQKPAQDLLPEDPEEAEALMRSLAAFICLGMVELLDAPEKRPVEAPFPVRERAVDRDEVEAYEEAGEEASPVPEPAAPEESEDFHDLIGDLEDTLGEIEEKAPEPEQQERARPRLKLEQALQSFHQDVRKKNYYEMFGLKPHEFDINKLKEEYFRLTKEFSPENFITSSGEVLEKAEDLLGRLATAYNTLSNVVSKEKYDEMLETSTRVAGIPGAKDHDKMQAEVAFQSGMAFMGMGDWDGAEKSLSEAASLAPDNPDIIAQYAYAVYNKNRRSKAAQKRAYDLVAQALKIKPRCASALAYRAALLLDDEKISLAEVDFKKALAINPRYRFALKGIKKIEAMKQEEKKGLFGRFRK